MSEPVTIERRQEVAVLRLDDGKANALSPGMLSAIQAGLDPAEKDASAVLLVGRPGRLSAGFDLKVMQTGPEAARDMVAAGVELLLRLYEFPVPVVTACTGHAIAAGALLLLASDARIGASGEGRIGLNEVAIGMTLPRFALELAQDRLSRRHFTRAVLEAELYAPEEAVDAGYLDRVVEPGALFDTAFAEATRLASLEQPAFRATKRAARAARAEAIRASLREITGASGR